MSDYTSGVANSICMAKSVTVSATDVTDEELSIDFRVDEVITFIVQVVTDAGINVPLVDAVITVPSNGVVNIANGATTFALVEDQVVSVIGVLGKV